MPQKESIRNFLISRRELITPESVGLPTTARRKVKGLKREEVALLAGVSIDYYARIERGNLEGVSQEILQAISSALKLSESESQYLINLADSTSYRVKKKIPQAAERKVAPEIQWLLNSMSLSPAWITNSWGDVFASNHLGRALLSPLFDEESNQGNLARFMFLSPASRNLFPSWELVADESVAAMRFSASQNSKNRAFTDLIGELLARSDGFANRWAKHNINIHATGVKTFNHPAAGIMELHFNVMALPAYPELSLVAYTAEPKTFSEEKLVLLGSSSLSAENILN
jgi:transcriptional regulator with XRE-family HTH domain